MFVMKKESERNYKKPPFCILHSWKKLNTCLQNNMKIKKNAQIIMQLKRHLSLETTTFALPTQELSVHKAIRKWDELMI